MTSPILVAPPAQPAVTLEEVKQHLRVEDGEQDALLRSFIQAATAQLEQRLDRALVTQTWRQHARCFDNIRLRPSPVDVESVEISYFDTDGAAQTLDGAVYWAARDAEGVFLQLAHGQSWPALYSRPDAITITYDAGAAVADVPSDLKVAIMLHVAFLYDHRSTHIDSRISPSSAYDALIRHYWKPKL